MTYWNVQPDWAGQTCFILACGPSLKGFDVSILRPHGPVIAINDAFMMAPWADLLYFCDRIWWVRHEQEVKQHFTGSRIATLDSKIPGVFTLQNTGESGLEETPTGVRNGRNSGYQAINLAYHLGVKRIVLLGYDMHVKPSGPLHWRARKSESNAISFDKLLRNLMLPFFSTLKQPLENHGVEVINATPGSLLTVWPQESLERVLTRLKPLGSPYPQEGVCDAF